MNIRIGGNKIGDDAPCYIVAEMSGNHGGSLDRAKEIIYQAKKSGADAVKIQVYKADTMTIDCNKPDFLIPQDNPWSKFRTLYDLYDYAHTPWEWIPELMDEAKKNKIDIFGSVFDVSSVALMENLDSVAYKIASPEIADTGLLKSVAATGKPVILSTGLASLKDLIYAVDILRSSGCSDLILLKCTTAYPAPVDEANLRTISNLRETFNVLSGISDHTNGVAVPIVATALGASFIEKHFTLDRNDTVDSFFSLDPTEFKVMVSEVRNAEKSLGSILYGLTGASKKHKLGRRSLYVYKPIKKGDKFSEKNIKSVRPAYGLAPKNIKRIIGRKAARDLDVGERVTWNVVE